MHGRVAADSGPASIIWYVPRYPFLFQVEIGPLHTSCHASRPIFVENPDCTFSRSLLDCDSPVTSDENVLNSSPEFPNDRMEQGNLARLSPQIHILQASPKSSHPEMHLPSMNLRLFGPVHYDEPPTPQEPPDNHTPLSPPRPRKRSSTGDSIMTSTLRHSLPIPSSSHHVPTPKERARSVDEMWSPLQRLRNLLPAGKIYLCLLNSKLTWCGQHPGMKRDRQWVPPLPPMVVLLKQRTKI